MSESLKPKDSSPCEDFPGELAFGLVLEEMPESESGISAVGLGFPLSNASPDERLLSSTGVKGGLLEASDSALLSFPSRPRPSSTTALGSGRDKSSIQACSRSGDILCGGGGPGLREAGGRTGCSANVSARSCRHSSNEMASSLSSRCDGRLQRGAGRRAGDVLSRLLVQLQLCQQGLLLLPDLMLPLLFLQLPQPPQLVLFLTVVVVEHLAPGAQIDVLLPQYVNQVHVLERERRGIGIVSRERCFVAVAVDASCVGALLCSGAVAPATPPLSGQPPLTEDDETQQHMFHSSPLGPHQSTGTH
ncbi:hypothetical protein EYF80_029444 [Liparis tanakae]|uniref:Uncharacterized protein n=1 Tax=Liparis tanakae TaxID=230148 RepID=A0A4Z2H5Q0_9TELE|nr:hypothetical protein EYF80_029444 [Liparis tanakae]